jgi:hypothetical protein
LDSVRVVHSLLQISEPLFNELWIFDLLVFKGPR